MWLVSSVDGDYTFTEVAPAAEAPVEETPAVAEAEEVATEASEAPVEVEASAEVETAAPEPVETVSEPEVVESATEAVKEPSAVMAVLEKIGFFIMHEKLLSIGILTCVVGLVYLIIVLIKTADRRPKKSDDYYYNRERAFDEEPETQEKTEDVQVSNEDDEFLKNLLSND